VADGLPDGLEKLIDPAPVEAVLDVNVKTLPMSAARWPAETDCGAEINAAGRSAVARVITPKLMLCSLCAAQIMSMSPARPVRPASQEEPPRW
jgi:hypothetical protein